MRIIVFGLGMIYEKFKNYIDKSSVVSLIDNNTKKQGTLVGGFEVKPPVSVVYEYYDYIIIMSTTYIQEMTEQLREYGVPDNKLKTYVDIGNLFEIPIVVKSRDKSYTLREWVAQHKRRIFVASHAMDRTGVPVALMNMSILLKKQGWSVVYGSLEVGKLSEELKEKDIEYIDDLDILSLYNKFNDLVKGFEIILVGTLALADVAVNFIKYNVPVIWWLHESERILFEKYNLPQGYDNVHYYGVGPRVIQKFKEFYPDGKIEELKYYLPEIRQYDKNKHEKMTFGLIGTYNHRKAYDVFFNAFDMIPIDMKGVSEVLAVCPYYTNANEEVKNKVESIPQIHVFDELTQEEIKEFYKKIDVFICPSRDDPMPIVVSEAMQNKIPCIVSNQVGQSAYMENNYGGYVFESENAEELSKLIVYCVENRDKVLQKGEEAYHIFRDNFSEEVIYNDVQKVIYESYYEK
jgi:hypothetical protein